MSQVIITIGREYGSGGREIGEKLAKKLNIPIYDKEIITESVKRSGFCQEIFETYDEHSTPSLLYSLAMGSFVMDQQISLPDQIFLEQFKTIRNLADKGSCIFIGRCADYVLEEKDNLISIFIAAFNLPQAIAAHYVGRLLVGLGIGIAAGQVTSAVSATVSCSKVEYAWTITNTSDAGHSKQVYGYKYHITDDESNLEGNTYYESPTPQDWETQELAILFHDQMFNYPAWEVISWT